MAGGDPGLQSVGALTFDVQGTCADFCRPMQGMGEAVNQAKGIAIDWGSVSAEWRSTTSSRAAGLPFDSILTAEFAHVYKPAPAVYQVAVDYLGYRPDQIMMAACHKYDLAAARAFGMRTAFVARPLEFGPAAAPDTASEDWFDVYAKDFVGLAQALGA